MRFRQYISCACLLLPLAAAASAQSQRAGWFRQARFGVFMHYLSDDQIRNAEDWNRRVDGFDVQALARQLESVGARYFILTLGQNSGYYLAPNATYDRLVGNVPPKCSRRDLVDDLYKVLEPRGIKLMVYLPAGAPDMDETAMRKLEWQKGTYRNREFQLKWEQVIREWSLRWGAHVKGWWFDGCYWPNTMYRTPEAPNFASLAAAARAGNPDSILSFNPGVSNRIMSITPEEDYTAGEIDDIERAGPGKQDGAQLHMLSYLGPRWGTGPAPRYSDAQITEWTTKLVNRGFVVTYDVPKNLDGTIPAAFVAQLRKIREAIDSIH